MDSTTEEALRDSIEKWKRNAEAETVEEYHTGSNSCPLCRLFVLRTESCEGCPVCEYTGTPGCYFTPWENAGRAESEWLEYPNSAWACRQAHEAAQREVEFLESLLPGGQP